MATNDTAASSEPLPYRIPKVDIYTSRFCPNSMRAKGLLDRKGIIYNEFFVDSDDANREVMVKRANGQNSLPQIFIGGRHIGGFEQLSELDSYGQLDAMLNPPVP
ncbi:MAG: glutaredoxin 3 [Synechococcaceae cyanobacterium]|nr:glutaredoxin 3 [Synechococcaceae cyanobacterium]